MAVGRSGGIAVRDEHASQTEPGRGGRRHARVIRLHAAARDQRVGPSREGIRGDEPHLADLVAAEREPDRVVALDEQARAAAERGAQPWQLLDRGGPGRERHGGQRGESAEHTVIIVESLASRLATRGSRGRFYGPGSHTIA